MTSRTEYCTQTPNKPSLFDVQYLRIHRTLDIGVLGYIGIVGPKEHSPEVRSFPPGTPCIKWVSYKSSVYESPVFFSQVLATSLGKCAQEQPVTTYRLTTLVRGDMYNDQQVAIQNATTNVNEYI